MGALATSKTTHVSVVVPMTGFALCSAFCYYVLFDERYRQKSVNPVPATKEEGESEVTGDESGEVRKVSESADA